MHLKDGLGEVVHLVEKEDSQAKGLVRQLVELVAFALDYIGELSDR